MDPTAFLRNINAAAARGAKLLDRLTPGWWRTHKLGKLATAILPDMPEIADFPAKRVGRVTKHWRDRVNIDGGYYGFYVSEEVAITGEPITRRGLPLELERPLWRLEPDTMLDLAWRDEIKRRRAVDNLARKQARIAKYGLAYEARRDRKAYVN